MATQVVSYRRARGLSLVELMVAITIGLILLAGTISIFISNKKTYEITDNLSRLQENARFAMSFMVDDLRSASYYGCSNDPAKVHNNITSATGGVLWDTSNALEGVDNFSSGGTWSPSGHATPTSPVVLSGTDAVTVRYLVGPGSGAVSASSDTAVLSAVGDLKAGDVAGVADCGSTEIARVKSISGTTATFYESLGRNFDSSANAVAAPLRAVRYYIGHNTTDSDVPADLNSLYRVTIQVGSGGALSETSQELLRGIDNMQILYGVDNNGDNAPDEYVTAGATNKLDTAALWATVVSVRVGLLLRTIDEYGTQKDVNSHSYNVFTGQLDCDATKEGCVTPTSLRVSRRVFTTTTFVRNQ